MVGCGPPCLAPYESNLNSTKWRVKEPPACDIVSIRTVCQPEHTSFMYVHMYVGMAWCGCNDDSSLSSMYVVGRSSGSSVI